MMPESSVWFVAVAAAIVFATQDVASRLLQLGSLLLTQVSPPENVVLLRRKTVTHGVGRIPLLRGFWMAKTGPAVGCMAGDGNLSWIKQRGFFPLLP